MNLRWIITLLGIPTGISFGTFLPRVEGIYIGKEGKIISAEEIESGDKKLSGTVGSKVQAISKNSKGNSNFVLSIPCMDEDFVNGGMKDIRGGKLDGVLDSKVKDIEDIMKEVANTIYGCESGFSLIREDRKEEIIKKRIKRVYKDSKKGKKGLSFGLETNYERTKNSVAKQAGKFFNGVQVEFVRIEKVDLNESKKLTDSIYGILIESIKQILREGKWSKGKEFLSNQRIESQYKTSERYPSEKNPSDPGVRNLMEKCAYRCLFSSENGVRGNPDGKSGGVADWFWEKMKSINNEDRKMGFKDVLLSMNFNGGGIRPVLEKVIGNNVYKWNKKGEKIDNKSECLMGGGGLVCSDGGIVGEKQ